MAKLIFPFNPEKAYDTGGHAVVQPLVPSYTVQLLNNWSAMNTDWSVTK